MKKSLNSNSTMQQSTAMMSLANTPATTKNQMSSTTAAGVLPSLISNYSSTANLHKNFIFPNIKKSVSLLNLRAQVMLSISLLKSFSLSKAMEIKVGR